MCVTPADTPVTSPLTASAVAIDVDWLDHAPPVTASLSVITAFTQTLLAPVIELGKGKTVNGSTL